MAASVLMKEDLFNYGTVTVGDKIKFNFEFKEGVTLDQIEYSYADCGSCTTYTITEKGVSGEVDTKLAGARQKGANQITKYVYLKLNDGFKYFKADANKKRMINPDVKLERLQILGVVINNDA